MQPKAAAFTISAEAAGDRRVKVVANTPDVDSQGTRLLPRGCETAAFLKNPIVLWGHRRDGDPDDAIGQVVDLQITDAAIIATVEFDDDGKALACLRKVRKGIIRSVSVGFLTIEQTEPDAKGIVTITRWALRELSFCHVPANASCVVVRSFTLRSAPLVASVLVQRESDGAQLWGRRRDSGKYTTPGGKVNPGEQPAAGAARELREEAGIVATPSQLQPLGVVEMPRVTVHCFGLTVPDSTPPTSAADPDEEVARWEWLPGMPAAADLHAVPNALARFAARTSVTNGARSPQPVSLRSFSSMNDILTKLGLKDDASPDEIVAALIKYVKESPDSDADKAALCTGLLSMLTPAPSASSGSDGMKAAAAEAMADEVRKLQARVAELEEQNKTATAAAEPTPEQRADAAIKDGRWPAGQRSALVEQYAAGKQPFLFAPKSFSTRSLTFTKGGKPASGAQTAPNFGSDDTVEIKTAAKGILNRAADLLKSLK